MFLSWCRRLARAVQPERPAQALRRPSLGLEQLEDRCVPAGGQFNFSLSNFRVLENAGQATITVTRTPGSTTFATVQFTTQGGTATPSVDYIPRAGSPANQGMLSFAPGELRKTFKITILNDDAIEGNETVGIKLMSPLGGATLGSQNKATLTIRDDDGTANQRFVAQAWGDLIGGVIPPSKLTDFNTLLSQGASQRSVVNQMIDTPEFRQALVGKLFRQYLQRNPDPQGLLNHAAILTNGGTLEDVKAALLGSAEYLLKRGGGTNGGFLAALYLDALGRPMDQAGRATYGQMIKNGATRTEVALKLLTSPEGYRFLLRGMFNQLLKRAPTADELTAGVTALRAGTRAEVLMAQLVGSSEYYNGLVI